MFDRCYYPCLGQLEGRPYATIICAGSDGENAQRQLDRIATGWRLRRVADRVIVNTAAQTPEAILAPKSIAPDRLAEARDLGAALAEGIVAGIFSSEERRVGKECGSTVRSRGAADHSKKK